MFPLRSIQSLPSLSKQRSSDSPLRLRKFCCHIQFPQSWLLPDRTGKNQPDLSRNRSPEPRRLVQSIHYRPNVPEHSTVSARKDGGIGQRWFHPARRCGSAAVYPIHTLSRFTRSFLFTAILTCIPNIGNKKILVIILETSQECGRTPPPDCGDPIRMLRF